MTDIGTTEQAPSPIYLLPDAIHSGEYGKKMFVEDTSKDRAPLFKDIHHYQLESFIAKTGLLHKGSSFNPDIIAKYLNKGVEGVVLAIPHPDNGIETAVAKIYFGKNLPSYYAETISDIVLGQKSYERYLNKQGTYHSPQAIRQNVVRHLHKAYLDTRLETDEAHSSTHKQIELDIAGMHIGALIAPKLILPPIAFITHEGKYVGHIAPYIHGTPTPIKTPGVLGKILDDPNFGLLKRYIKWDIHGDNAIRTPEGSIKLVDVSLKEEYTDWLNSPIDTVEDAILSS